MPSKKIIFIVLAIAIVAVPLFVIFSSENILENGHRHKLHLQGFDPFDPFRGKYLRLNYENNIPSDGSLRTGDLAYVTFATDSLGFSYFAFASAQKPAHSNYLAATVREPGFFWNEEVNEGVSIDLDNLTKYFIKEDKAFMAEQIVMDYTNNHPDDIYVAIRVLDGEARIEDIYIKDTPLMEYLEQ